MIIIVAIIFLFKYQLSFLISMIIKKKLIKNSNRFQVMLKMRRGGGRDVKFNHMVSIGVVWFDRIYNEEETRFIFARAVWKNEIRIRAFMI